MFKWGREIDWIGFRVSRFGIWSLEEVEWGRRKPPKCQESKIENKFKKRRGRKVVEN